MLSFLRKLRKAKSSRYLSYAFGEIFLVVIGIFLAVQINNWNEYRKREKVVSDLINLLEADIKEDLDALKALDSTYQEIDILTNLILDQYKTLKPIEQASSQYFINLLLETNFKSQQNAYDILKESGLFSSLDVILQNELMHYYSTVEEILAREIISNSFIQNKYEPILFGRHPNLLSKSNLAPPIQAVYYNDPRPIDSQVIYKMFEDKELEVIIVARQYQNNKQWDQYKLGIEEIKKILPLLENY